MQTGSIELEVRGVRMPTHDALPGAVLVGRRHQPDNRVLLVHIGAGDVHALHHELRGQQTMRSRAVCLVGRVAAALGGRLRAARLVAAGAGRLAAVLEVDAPAGPVEVPAEPGQALAAAVCLRVPLRAEAALFPPSQPGQMSLSGPVASFLDTLDLSELGGRE
jgi:bifunctional DNase/RNase